ncbi:uncharacterized protein LOC124145178 [Haliotis rufescens]|uniref:uncharacterized protein LOC124145178 n=1 Tax=Haliotis rufescens TaxID=6454 RepID=UPI00201F7556|nr:uncharacterized protein LOC124145178 [Haliotis rufescens]
MTFKSDSKKKQERSEHIQGLLPESRVNIFKIPSIVFYFVQCIAVQLYRSVVSATEDSQMADYCEEDNTLHDASSKPNRLYREINEDGTLVKVLSKILYIDRHFDIPFTGAYFVDSVLPILENESNPLEALAEHSKGHPEGTREWLRESIKQRSEVLSFHGFKFSELLTVRINSIEYEYMAPTFGQNAEPCLVDLKRFQEKLTTLCGTRMSYTELPDKDLSDVLQREQYQQILKTLNHLEHLLEYRPPIDVSTGHPDESKMQYLCKTLERFLLQRIEIESQNQLSSPFITLRDYFEKLARREAVDTEEEMRHEGLRFASFNRINVNTSSLRLAAAGFYATGDGDETRCFSCGVTHRNWTVNDNPFVIHSQISPNCIHTASTDERNVPIQLPSDYASVNSPTASSGSTSGANKSGYTPTQLQGAVGININTTTEENSQSVDEIPDVTPVQTAHYNDGGLSSSQTSTLRFEDAVHPHYSNAALRLDSFQLWPEGHSQHPEELARAGFFYAGYSDCVRCFVCGVGLRTWEEGDDPWVEHVRWRSSCAYLEAARGKNFVIQTLAAIARCTQTSQSGENHQSAPDTRHNYDTSEEDVLRTGVCGRALEMGFSREQVRSAAQSTINSRGRQALRLDVLLENIFAADGESEQVQASQGGYSDVEHHSQGQTGQEVKEVLRSGVGNMDSTSSDKTVNNTTRQAHLLRSPAGKTDSGYKSLPIENHAGLPPTQQTSGNFETEHPFVSSNIKYNLEIVAPESPGAKPAVSEETERQRQSDAPVNRFSSLPTNRHEVKGIDKIKKNYIKKGKRKEEVKATEEETRQLRESSTCKVCLEDPANIVFLPCGHLVACAVCTPALERCPVCRTHIRGTVRVHLADMASREKQINYYDDREKKISVRGVPSDTSDMDQSSLDEKYKEFIKDLKYGSIDSMLERSYVVTPFISLRDHFTERARDEATAPDEEMRFEGLRLKSFDQVNMNVSYLQLAKAGFYATGDGDETQCFSCGVTHKNWHPKDNPHNLHSRKSPNCIHITGTDARNVPIHMPAVSDGSHAPQVRNWSTHETQQLKESSVCKVCLERPANIVLLPCGHLVACAVCTPALECCPVCRTHIRGKVCVDLALMVSREKEIE